MNRRTIGVGEHNEEHADATEKQHVVETGAPHGLLRAVRLFRAEVLPDQRRRGIAQSPRRQNDEDHDANRDRVARERRRSEDADDAHQADPARIARWQTAKFPSPKRAASRISTCEIERDLPPANANPLRTRAAAGKTGTARRCERPVNVASAAPVTPICGNGPSPKIRHGSSTRLMMFDTHSSRIAIAASPAPRKMALFRNSSMIAPLPPSAMRA